MKTIELSVWDNDDNETIILLPTKRAICSRCNGDGVHTNPAIDGNGISAETFHEDPEFREDYFNGVYDIQCEECHGEKIVDIVDVDAMSYDTWKAWETDQRERMQDEMMRRAELRAGC